MLVAGFEEMTEMLSWSLKVASDCLEWSGVFLPDKDEVRGSTPRSLTRI
jgi:hypothetical protein